MSGWRRGVWRLEVGAADPDRPTFGRLHRISFVLPNGYHSDGRDVWEKDLRDLAELLRDALAPRPQPLTTDQDVPHADAREDEEEGPDPEYLY